MVQRLDKTGSMTPFQKARLGLAELLQVNGDGHKKAYWHERDKQQVRLPSHPFGSDIAVPGAPDANKEVFLLDFPGSTDGSVRAMKIMLHEELRGYLPNNSWHFRLRITRVRVARDWHDQTRFIHDLYFELITYVGTFICGGCNDYTGGGGSGGRELENIFHFIGALFQVPVEEKIIEHDGEVLKQELVGYWNAGEQARRAA